LTHFLKERFSREEQIVFDEIDNHRGRDFAISVPILTRCVQIRLGESISEVKIREIVRTLIVEHGMPIGSATNHPPGYYIITDAKELKEAIRSLKGRIYKLSIRAKRLEDYDRRNFVGQLELELPEKIA